ncbi:MAG: hypothetical protein HUJ59_02020 [Bacilli bacterium]|nr:hypothetical protein [Bacilli bacterium]
MSKSGLVGILLGIIFAFITWVATGNLIVSGVILLLTILEFFLFINKRFKAYQIKLTRFRECYHFVNNFIVSLSIKGSILSSLENVTAGASDELLDHLDGVKDLNEHEKIQYLNRYFPFYSYQLFLDVILLWLEEGGDILEMSQYLTNNLRSEEEYIAHCEKVNKKTMFEFAVLWGFTIVIIFVLRFVLSSFYELFTKQFLYVVGIAMVFILALLSIEILTRKMVNVEIKGWKDERK